jgi:hypothetical protein
MGSPFRTINSLSKGIEVDTINPRREGGPDIQCHGSFGELDPSILDVAIAGYRGLKARDVVGYSTLQFVLNVPLVLFLIWILNYTSK